MEQILFEAVLHIGETLNEAYHIIDTTDEYRAFEGDKSFRVYHSKGYCFDVGRETKINEETGEVAGINYYIFDEYDDFLKGSAVLYYKLLK